jgi:FkbM family methyltransferase
MNIKDFKKKIVHRAFAWRDFYDTYLARTGQVVKTPLGFSMKGGNSQHHKAMQNGSFEPTEVKWIRTCLNNSGVFVDVGANIGYFTCLARSMGKPVVAIEPLQYNLKLLLENIEINNGESVEVFPLALSAKAGVLRLFGASSTGASLIQNWAGASTFFSRLVPVNTLDRILDGKFLNKQLLIKVDVEGAEFDVLSGALETLGRQIRPTWLVEITGDEYMPSGANFNLISTFDLFFQRGYQASLLTKSGLIPINRARIEKWRSQGRSEYSEINFVFSAETPV